MNIHQAFLSALLLAAAALPAAVSFESEVKPIFEKHCVECHGPKKQKSEFRLDDREIADVATYVLRTWGGRNASVTPQTVADIRGAHPGRMNPWTLNELSQRHPASPLIPVP